MKAIKKLYAYITGKSIKQRICICVVLTAMLTFVVFIIKGNFIDKPPQTANTSMSESAENSEEPTTDPPKFHISLIDSGVLLGAIAVYSVHKIREKRKQGRL